MPQTVFDGIKLVTNPYAKAVLKSIATSDELFGLMPFVPKPGDAYTYTREKSLGAIGFVADTHTTVSESTGADELVTVPKREAVEDFHVRNLVERAGGGQFNSQVLKKAKALGRALASACIAGAHTTGITMLTAAQSGAYVDALVSSSARLDSGRYGAGLLKYTHTGTFLQFQAPGDKAFGPQVACASDGDYQLFSDNPNKWIKVTLDVSDATANTVLAISFTSSTNSIDGLAKLIAPAMVRASVGTDGDEPSFAILDQLLDVTKIKDNRVFAMPASLRRKFEALGRASGYQLNNFKIPNTGTEVPSYKGIPLLTNDNIPETEAKGALSTLSSVYCASLSDDEGFHLVAMGDGELVADADPRKVNVLGVRVYTLGQIQAGPSAEGGRVSWIGASGLGSDLAAARASELKTL